MIDLTWVEKYATYEQSTDGELTVTDHHFLAEVCYRELDQVENLQATLVVAGTNEVLSTYDTHDPRTFSNGTYYTRKSKSYDDLAALDAARPPDEAYEWCLKSLGTDLRLAPIRIGGASATTQIPTPCAIRLQQDGSDIDDVLALRAEAPLTIEWDPFESGELHEGTEWDDLIFVLVSDARGEIVYESGAPTFDSGFLDCERTSVELPGGLLRPGTDYVVFMSQVKYVDNNMSNGVQQLACNSFAVELPVRTAGVGGDSPGPLRKAAYLWGGKTPRAKGMVPWPAFPDT